MNSSRRARHRKLTALSTRPVPTTKLWPMCGHAAVINQERTHFLQQLHVIKPSEAYSPIPRGPR